MVYLLKNKYNEVRSGWVLLISGIILFLILMLVGFAVALITGDGAVRVLNTPFADYPLMIVALLLLFRFVYNRPLNQMGFYSNDWFKQLALGGLFGIVLISLMVLIMWVGGLIQFTGIYLNNFAYWKFWNGLLVFIGVGFFEEIFSRGFIMTVLKTTRNKWVIVLFSSSIFGVLHIANPSTTPFALVNITLIGILIAYLFIKTGRIWASIGIHITWNFIQGNIFGSLVSGVETMSIMQLEVIGNEWLTGGEFGFEGGVICTLVVLFALLYVHFCIKHNENFWRMDSNMPLNRSSNI